MILQRLCTLVVLIILIAPVVAVAQNQQAPQNQAAADLRAQLEEINRKLDEVIRDKVSEQRLTEIVEALQDQINTVSRKVDAITRADRQGNTIPSLLSNMDRNPEFRDEMAIAVQRVMPPQRGRLRVRNTSAIDAHLRVNGATWRIPAGNTVDIGVPTGAVTTELLGMEPAKSWNIGPPNYEFVLDITPSSPAVSYYMPRPVY
jgi:hypothetical protein